jgi:hypothetical protein
VESGARGKKTSEKTTNVGLAANAVRVTGESRSPGRVFRQARRGSRDGTRGKAAASRGCCVSGNGGSRRGAHPSTRAVGPDVACPVPSRERGVARVARWRARG